MKDNSIVYIIDDDQSLCQSLGYLLESVKIKYEIFNTPKYFLEQYKRVLPSCLLLDIRMPELSGLQLQDILNSRKVSLPIIFMTGHGDISSAVRAMKEGAFDFFTKPFNHHLLLESIQKAIILDKKNLELESNCHNIDLLTSQQKTILELIAGGDSSKRIANEMHLSHKTIEYHRAKIMQKLGARSLAQLVRAYYMWSLYARAPQRY